jgi:elongation factor G
VAGIQVGTHKAWRAFEKAGLARTIVITGLDRENADFFKILETIRSVFGSRCVPVTFPTSDGKGVIDVLSAKDLPADIAENVKEAKNSLVELAAETNDSLIEKYLGGEELSADEIAKGLDSAIRKGSLVPVFACRAMKDVGLVELLEGIARLFPSPASHAVKDAAGNAIGTGKDDPFVGFVWRAVNDPFIGQMTFVRVLGGTLKADSEVFNATKNQKERITTLLVMNGKKQTPITQATAGDIVAIPKLKATGVNDTLCAMGKTVQCERIVFPQPVMIQCVSAKTQADEDKLGVALSRVADEDPTLKMERNRETKETLLSGLGDVHIDVAVELMKNRSKVEVVLSTPKVPYRETVTGLGDGHYKHKKQSGGRGQYGEVYLKVQTKRPDDQEWFVDATVGGSIPGNFIPAVEKGVVEGMVAGSVAGYPVQDVKISVYDGSYHEVDSSEIAFKIAGARAFKDAMSKARPVLLEPIMTVKVYTPDQFMGEINGDLNHRRGRILGMGPEDGMQVITAEVPQAELFRYPAELRSITGGQGFFEMEFNRYDVVPTNVAQKVVAAAAKNKEAEKED